MIYLAKQSGFDIKVDNVIHDLILEKGVEYSEVLEGTMDYVRRCLINRGLDVPVHLYRVYQDLHSEDTKFIKEEGLRYDLLLMPPNVAGIEYVKTHGHRTPFATKRGNYSYPVIIEILYGGATFLLQKFVNGEVEEGVGPEVERVMMIKAQKGSKVVIPPGYYYTVINTRNSYLITGRLSVRWEEDSERAKMEGKHGFAYYLIRKNARQEIVKNPHYRETPRLEKVKAEETTKQVSIRSGKSLVELMKKNPERFEFLKWPNRIDWAF